MDSHCKSCRYFLGKDTLGQCRRYPVYQNRHENEWCGEFENRKYSDEPTPIPTFESMARELTSLTIYQEPKKRGRPTKNA